MMASWIANVCYVEVFLFLREALDFLHNYIGDYISELKEFTGVRYEIVILGSLLSYVVGQVAIDFNTRIRGLFPSNTPLYLINCLELCVHVICAIMIGVEVFKPTDYISSLATGFGGSAALKLFLTERSTPKAHP